MNAVSATALIVMQMLPCMAQPCLPASTLIGRSLDQIETEFGNPSARYQGANGSFVWHYKRKCAPKYVKFEQSGQGKNVNAIVVEVGDRRFRLSSPKPVPAPTQADIVKGCITVRNIVFEPPHGYFISTGVSGTVTNNCGREASITIIVKFWDRYNNMIYTKILEKLAKPGDTDFSGGPENNYDIASEVRTGKVTMVSGGLL